jgi:hypothetical protein
MFDYLSEHKTSRGQCKLHSKEGFAEIRFEDLEWSRFSHYMMM